jgi:hypothetical protein
MPGLGRLIEFDERSRNYPVRALLGAPRPARSFTWTCPVNLDQGNVGACVGFSWAAELAAKPKPVAGIGNEIGTALYRRAQQLDQWPGEAYSGSSVIAGAKAVTERGHLAEYRWAFGPADALEAIAYRGPVVIGINWYEGMNRPDSTSGRIQPTGRIVGGHAVLVNAVSIKRQDVTLHNSWSRGWGFRGTARLAWADFERLLNEDGECCVPVRRTTPKVTT